MSKVTNRLTYQKGGWTLHMLRGIIGTEAFWTGIRDYYRRYRDRNASTADFRQVMEQASGQQLSWFFDQWLNRAGIPIVAGSWRYDAMARQVEIELSQTQTGDAYRLPIEVGITEPGRQGARRACGPRRTHRPVQAEGRGGASRAHARSEYLGADAGRPVCEAAVTDPP